MPISKAAPRNCLVALLVGTVALCVGCSSSSGSKDRSFVQKIQHKLRSSLNDSYHDDTADTKMTTAEDAFKAGDFETAQKIYADLAGNTYNAASMIERSRYMEGECLRARKKYPAAVDAYHRMLQDFPAGVYSERAAEHMYNIAEIWLKDVVQDIEDEKKGKNWARRARLPNFTDSTRPTTDLEGELVKTLENVANGCPTAPFADKAMFWAGYIHFSRGRFEEADHFFSPLVEYKKDSPLRQEALKFAVMAKNNSTGGAAYDGQKSAEALQLVHHIEATDPRYTRDKEKTEWMTRQKMAIRMQQAQKDFDQAEYYKRTNHLGSAYWYYDMVQRRYPGTKLSDLAKERLLELENIKKERALAAKREPSAWDSIKTGFDRFLNGKGDEDEDKIPADPTPKKNALKRPEGPAPPPIPGGPER